MNDGLEVPLESRRGDYAISSDPGRLDLDVIHGFLSNSYWAKDIPRRTVERAIAHSLPFGVYLLTSAAPLEPAPATGSAAGAHTKEPARTPAERPRSEQQVGFARVVSDHATFAYLADVFILPAHRGQGLAVWLIETLLGHPELQSLRRWSLATRDAHSLYRRFGWGPLVSPDRWMERLPPGRYARDRAPGEAEPE